MNVVPCSLKLSTETRAKFDAVQRMKQQLASKPKQQPTIKDKFSGLGKFLIRIDFGEISLLELDTSRIQSTTKSSK